MLKGSSMWEPSRACGKILVLRVKFQQNPFKEFSQLWQTLIQHIKETEVSAHVAACGNKDDGVMPSGFVEQGSSSKETNA